MLTKEAFDLLNQPVHNPYNTYPSFMEDTGNNPTKDIALKAANNSLAQSANKAVRYPYVLGDASLRALARYTKDFAVPAGKIFWSAMAANGHKTNLQANLLAGMDVKEAAKAYKQGMNSSNQYINNMYDKAGYQVMNDMRRAGVDLVDKHGYDNNSVEATAGFMYDLPLMFTNNSKYLTGPFAKISGKFPNATKRIVDKFAKIPKGVKVGGKVATWLPYQLAENYIEAGGMYALSQGLKGASKAMMTPMEYKEK